MQSSDRNIWLIALDYLKIIVYRLIIKWLKSKEVWMSAKLFFKRKNNPKLIINVFITSYICFAVKTFVTSFSKSSHIRVHEHMNDRCIPKYS